MYSMQQMRLGRRFHQRVNSVESVLQKPNPSSWLSKGMCHFAHFASLLKYTYEPGTMLCVSYASFY